MNRRVTLLLLLVAAAVGGLGWLHFQVVPGIRWSSDGGIIFSEGWRAVVKSWPIYLTSGLGAGLIGFMLFAYIGESERERAHKLRAEKSEAESALARKDAENAAQRAQAALEDKQREASEQIKIAKSERKATAHEVERIRAQNAELRAAHDTMNKRLRGALKALERGKQRERERRQNAMANASRDQADSGVNPIPPWAE